MEFNTLATPDVIERTSAALTSHLFIPISVATKEEALAKIQELIPAGASVNNGASKTLEKIGYADLLKSGAHSWNNLHGAILAETDPVQQSLLRKQNTVTDFYLGSVHAITETGELIFSSATGSQLPAIAFNAQNLILVAGAQKIVPTLPDAFQRIREYVVPLEDVNMKEKYGADSGTLLAKTLILHQEHPMMKRKVYVLIVNESLGF